MFVHEVSYAICTSQEVMLSCFGPLLQEHGALDKLTEIKGYYMTITGSRPRDTIAAVILTFNNRDIIGRLLRTINWMDEIIVIDSGSTDGTQDIVSAICPRARIFERMLDSFAEQRNLGLRKVRSTWVMHLDSDDELTEEISDEIRKSVLESGTRMNGFRYIRKEYYRESPMQFAPYPRRGELRLHRLGKGVWRGIIDEQIELDGDAGVLSGYVKHHGIPDFGYFVTKVNHYTDKQVERYYKRSDRTIRYVIKSFFAPIKTFFRLYFLRKGFMDGYPGFAICVIRAFAVFLFFVKYWEYGKTAEQPRHP